MGITQGQFPGLLIKKVLTCLFQDCKKRCELVNTVVSFLSNFNLLQRQESCGVHLVDLKAPTPVSDRPFSPQHPHAASNCTSS